MKIEVKKILSIVLLSLVYILVTTFVQYRYKNSFGCLHCLVSMYMD